MIERVEHLATEQKSLVMTDGYPMFEWLPRVKVDDTNEEQDKLYIEY